VKSPHQKETELTKRGGSTKEDTARGEQIRGGGRGEGGVSPGEGRTFPIRFPGSFLEVKWKRIIDIRRHLDTVAEGCSKKSTKLEKKKFGKKKEGELSLSAKKKGGTPRKKGRQDIAGTGNKEGKVA